MVSEVIGLAWWLLNEGVPESLSSATVPLVEMRTFVRIARS